MVLLVAISACSPSPGSSLLSNPNESPTGVFLPAIDFATDFPDPPVVPTGPLDPAIENEIGSLLASIRVQGFDREALDAIGSGGDVRVAWFLADLMRFFQGAGSGLQLNRVFQALTGAPLDTSVRTTFTPASNLLLAWDIPAWDGYEEAKRQLYTILEPKWEPFFTEDVSIDWREVTWGGVLIDDRPLGDNGPCTRGCIPALDDPETVSGSEVSWYADSDVVFGIVLNNEALALPKNQMQVHEMVNLSLGGQRLGIPYCTLCGSAQAYLTERIPDGFDPVVLRTSGLLARSNKVMYDLNTKSVFDTFTGEALSGPLAEAGVVLDQLTVVASTWKEWKEAHPDTRIIAQDGGIGRVYDRNPLGDRDADGPIFPIGAVDPRLPVHELVVGVVASDGTPVAFPTAATREALGAGAIISYQDLDVMLDGDGLRVSGPDGEVPAHEAFWFAWSQFHRRTLVWAADAAAR